MNETTALEIYRKHLDLVTTAVWERNWDVVKQNLAVPTVLRSQDTELAVETMDDLFDAIKEVRASMVTMGATAYFRVARHAEFSDALMTRIEGRHTTYIMTGGYYALPPFESTQTLKLENGVWKGWNMRAGVRNSTLTVINPATARRLAPRPPARPDTANGT
ncbi:hypothetical protein [Tropicibacter oceani]|uniref:Uncharacterized protein n=1 Tax=Tropicibacter oceani TaxID=3058420 RepID=A0ABY8QLY6_9RHOB|nr:hypothetical protein [Tropicibacter oceani]WGW05655.1 hypothetical protein QF118_08950 [Tropicibacter oceani]